MATEEDQFAGPDERFWEQFAEVERQHRPLELKVAQVTPRSGELIPARYVYERGVVLVPDVYAARVRHHLELAVDKPPGLSRQLVPSGVPGVSMLTVVGDPPAQEGIDASGPVQDAVDWINHRCQEPVAAPNHLVSITAPVNLCPNDEPRPRSDDSRILPPVADTAGTGVDVMIVDTGLPSDHLRPSLGGQPREIIEPSGPFAGTFKLYAGHGAFVASILQSVAPGTKVWVSNALQRAGSLTEREFIPALLRDLDEYEQKHGHWPDIVNISAGATSHRGQRPVTMKALLDALDAHPATIVVAAAGNDGAENEPFWPASCATDHRGVISVGALRRDEDGLACFSNYGDSVTVFALGERVASTFLTGDYHYRHRPVKYCRYHPDAEDERHYGACTCVTAPPDSSVSFHGTAEWSGTSFATAVVAGKIAAHMTETGEDNAREAAWDLIERRTATIGDLRSLKVT
jgi:subtilisin family serine protease